MRTTDSSTRLADEARGELEYAKYLLGVSASRCNNEDKLTLHDLRDRVKHIIEELEPIAYAR